MAMLDVEYMRMPSQFGKCLVYVYRTGFFRSRMRRVLQQLADSNQSSLYSSEPQQLLAGSFLFSGTYFCDWSEGPAKVRNSDALLSLLDLHDDNPIAVFVKEGDWLLEALQAQVAEKCYLVEEPPITLETLPHVLDYLRHDSDLSGAKNLKRSEAFEQYFAQLLTETPSLGLPGLVEEFDKAILLYVDPRTGVFDGVNARADQEATRAEMQRPLRQFVKLPSETSLASFVQGVAGAYYRGRAEGMLIDDLCRMTTRVLSRRAVLQPDKGIGEAADDDTGRDPNSLIWAAILISWIPRLRSSCSQSRQSSVRTDDFVVMVDQLCREFQKRAGSGMAADPLAGGWVDLYSAVACLISSKEEREAEAILLESFAQSVKRSQNRDHWQQRVQALLESKHSPNATPGPDNTAPATAHYSFRLPIRFDDIVGHDVVVRSLQGRFEKREHSTPLIFQGPQGIGKQSLARVYAKALLCVGERKALSSACGFCESCREVDRGGGFGLIEFDASMRSAVEEVRYQLGKLEYASFARHRVIIFRNLDKSPEIAEIVLKTLERRFTATTFVITVCDLEDLSDPIRSRCAIYPMSYLKPADMRHVCRRFLLEMGVACCDDSVALIAAASEGSVRLAEERCRIIADNRMERLDDVRRTLGLDWAEETIQFLRELFGETFSRTVSNFGELREPTELIYRIRVILAHLLRPEAPHGSLHPALWHLDPAQFRDLLLLLKARAEANDVDERQLLADLAHIWLSDGFADLHDVSRATLESRKVIRRRSGETYQSS